MTRITKALLKLVVYYSPIWFISTLVGLFRLLAAPHFRAVAPKFETGQIFLIASGRNHPALYVTRAYYLASTVSSALFLIGMALVLLMLASIGLSRFRRGSASNSN